MYSFEGNIIKLLQNGTNIYHPRGAPMPKMNNLHRNMQSPNPHPGHWTPFCGMPLREFHLSTLKKSLKFINQSAKIALE